MPKPRVSLDSTFLYQLSAEFSPETPALIGVSGGRDSMVLLHLLKLAGFENLIVCHVNHGLRGSESEADADLVAKIAAELEFKCESKTADVAKYAAETKQSLELAARQVRHDFFAEMALKHDCTGIFLAHHADDQVETVLMNFFRGSGLRGLGGMRRSSEFRHGARDLIFNRPLLEVWGEAIDLYCSENSIPFREDRSNFDPEFAVRNRVRQQLIPDLADIFGRDIRGAVERLSRVLKMEEAVRESQIDSVFDDLIDDNGALDSKKLAEMTEADQFRIVARWLSESGVPDCGFSEIQRVLDLLSESGDPAKINLPADVHARRRAGRIFLEK